MILFVVFISPEETVILLGMGLVTREENEGFHTENEKHNTELFSKNMVQKPLLYPKTQIKFVFHVNSPFHHHPKKFFQRFFFNPYY